LFRASEEEVLTQGVFKFLGILPGESVVEEEPCFGSAHGMIDGKEVVPQLGFFDNDFRGWGMRFT